MGNLLHDIIDVYAGCADEEQRETLRQQAADNSSELTSVLGSIRLLVMAVINLPERVQNEECRGESDDS